MPAATIRFSIPSGATVNKATTVSVSSSVAFAVGTYRLAASPLPSALLSPSVVVDASSSTPLTKLTFSNVVFLQYGRNAVDLILNEETTIATTTVVVDPLINTTQQQLVNSIPTKANSDSPAFSGMPTAPTANIDTMETTQLATTGFVKNSISAMIDSAPDTLDTLKELAAAINNDPAFYDTIVAMDDVKAPKENPTFTGTITNDGVVKFNNDVEFNSNANFVDGSNANFDYGSRANFNNSAANFNNSAANFYDSISDFVNNSSAIFNNNSSAIFNNKSVANFESGSTLAVKSGATVTGLTKTMVGLGTVDNTPDILKPISIATQTALNLKANLASASFTGAVTIPQLIVSRVIERMASGTVSGNTLTCDYSTSALFNVNAPPSSSFVLNVTNLSTQLNASYSITLIINSVPNKTYATTLQVNGTSIPIQFLGGSTSIPSTASATYIQQTITLMYSDKSIPMLAYTSINPIQS